MAETTTRPRVAVLTAPGEGRPPGLEALEPEAALQIAETAEQLATALREADILLVTDFRTGLLREAWPAARHLRWVHAASAGVDALCFPELVDSDIPLTNARGVFDAPIAEYALGLMLAFAKDLPATLEHQRKRRWFHRDNERLAGKRLLVVGAGSIGRAIGRLAKVVGMAVEGVASTSRPGDADFPTIHGVDGLATALANADYVVAAAPLTARTRGLFGTETFAAMKPGARFINVGRGPVVQTDALVAALHDGRLAGAALDVFEMEPLPEEHPLWAMPQVIVSPHMAGDVHGWREALGAQFVANFRRWRAGEPLENVVDKSRMTTG